MRHRFTKVLLGAALFMLLGGTATVAVPASSMNNAAPSMTFVKRWRMNASS